MSLPGNRRHPILSPHLEERCSRLSNMATGFQHLPEKISQYTSVNKSTRNQMPSTPEENPPGPDRWRDCSASNGVHHVNGSFSFLRANAKREPAMQPSGNGDIYSDLMDKDRSQINGPVIGRNGAVVDNGVSINWGHRAATLTGLESCSSKENQRQFSSPLTECSRRDSLGSGGSGSTILLHQTGDWSKPPAQDLVQPSSGSAFVEGHDYPVKTMSDVFKPGRWSVTPEREVMSKGRTLGISVPKSADIEVNQPEPHIFASIREVLQDKQAYTEYIIRAVQHLPGEKQDILLGTQSDSTSLPTPVDDEGDNGSAQSPDSTDTGDGASYNFGKAKKRKATQDQNGNNGEGDELGDRSGGGSDEGSRDGNSAGRKDKKRKAGKSYACPYCVAFQAAISSNPKFQSCRSSVYRPTRSTLRQHLHRTHTPVARAKAEDKAKNLNPEDAHYYMTEKQWKDVQNEIKKAGKKHYTENSREWLDNELKCFLAIWEVLFPAAQFPSLPKPISPFDGGEAEPLVLQQLGKILLEAVHSARANMAAKSGCIVSTDEYHPTHSEYIEMMSECFAIVTNLDSAVSTRIIDTSTEKLRDAAIRATGASDAIADASTDSSPTPSLPVTLPEFRSTISCHLVDPLTDIRLRVATTSKGRNQHPPVVQVNIPAGVVSRSFEQRPVSTQELDKQQLFEQQLANAHLFNQQLPYQPQFSQLPANTLENIFPTKDFQMGISGPALQPSANAQLLETMQMNGGMASPLTRVPSQPTMYTSTCDIDGLQTPDCFGSAT
ncbi:hypothetical protein BGZ63DRAFT_406997 [Mariannaea sp. PMI_226]|nr:hypothetical protein BGZ63DRAFT_406997 [Mariannaea sp. PMI_226]